MTLLTIAELMAGELLVSPGGLVDRLTATGEDHMVWQHLVVPPLPAATAERRELAAAGV
jgi:hypothetical protein